MGEKVSTFSIAFDGDAGDIGSVLAALKSSIRSTVSELEATTKKVQLFGDLEKQTQTAAAAFAAAKTKVNDLTAALEKAKAAGTGSTDELTKGLKVAQQELRGAERELNKNVDALTKLENQLTATGVDTGKLASEELRLAEATRVASAAFVEQQSKAALSFKSFRDIQPEINRLNAAFISLRDSGKLSFGELSTAQARLQQQITALRAEAGGLGQAFFDIRGRLLAVTAAFAGITAGVFDAAKGWRDFAQQVAAIDSIADASKATIDRLARGVRDLAISMGVDAVQSARALYEIISSGIPADNALQVLAVSSKAAIAGLTDVDTAARVGVSVLNAYGLQVSQLPHIFDVLFQTVKDGIVTFPELAKNIGVVLPAARAAKVPIEELGAAFVVLTRQGIDAPEAATAINRAIIDLAAPAPQAADRLRELGIEVNGLTGTIEQLAARKLTLGQLSEIVPDQRAVRAVLALTQNFALLRDELGSMNREAAQTEAAYLKLADTPQQQVARFEAAWKDLTLSLGEFVTGSGGVVTSLTSLVNSFNALTPATKDAVFELTAFVVVGGTLTFLARQLAVPLNLLAGALFEAGAGGQAAATGMTAASLAAGTLKVALAGFLGFEVGTFFRDNSAAVRVFGDVLGASAAAVVNLGTLIGKGLYAALTLNKQGLVDAYTEWRRNSDIIRDDFGNALTGATGRLRELDTQHAQLVTRLAQVSAAAAEAAGKVESSLSRIAANIDTELRGVDQIVSQLQVRLVSLTAGLQQIVQATAALATSALGNLAADTTARLAALDALQLKEIAQIRETTKIHAEEAKARLDIIEKYKVDVLKAFDAEAASRTEIAKRTGEDLKKVEQALATERRALIQSLVDQTRAATAEALALWNSHLANIKALDEQKIALTESVESKIREIRRGTMTASQQYSDQVYQVEQLISKARQALASDDAKNAEKYAQEAIGIAGSLGKAVIENGRTVVSQYSAQEQAVGLLKRARDIELGAIENKKEAEQAGAIAAKAAYESDRAQLAELTRLLDATSARVKEGLALQITANTDAVTRTIASLDVQIKKQEHLLEIKADITKAQVEVKRLKDELEAGITANVKGRTDELEKAIQKIRDERPEITLDATKALAAVEEVRAKAAEVVNVRVQIDSNAAAVKSEIDSLNGRNTSSTHTIYVTKVETNASGGFVGEAARGYAAGGNVFPSPSWQKVPGAGDQDSVPARLPVGSFVMRKAASQHIGDSMMARLARGFALGGLIGTLGVGNALAMATGGSLSSIGAVSQLVLGLGSSAAPGTTQPGQATVDETDAAAVLWFAREVLEKLGGTPGAERIFGYAAADARSRMIYVSRHPTDKTAIAGLLRTVATIGGNLHLTAFWERTSSSGLLPADYTWEQFNEDIQSGAISKPPPVTPMRHGGVAGEVPAWLMPGEWVIRPPAVAAISRMFGGGFLHALNALNALEAPRAFHSGGPVLAAGKPLALAAGGAVGSWPMQAFAQPASAAPGAGKVEINVTTNEPLSEEYVRRILFPLVNKINNRAR